MPYSALTQYLVNHGYAVLDVNNRGSSGYGKTFYKAEDYHQEYYKMHGSAPYCRAVIDPKIAKFREHFRDKLKSN